MPDLPDDVFFIMSTSLSLVVILFSASLALPVLLEPRGQSHPGPLAATPQVPICSSSTAGAAGTQWAEPPRPPAPIALPVLLAPSGQSPPAPLLP